MKRKFDSSPDDELFIWDGNFYPGDHFHHDIYDPKNCPAAEDAYNVTGFWFTYHDPNKYGDKGVKVAFEAIQAFDISKTTASKSVESVTGMAAFMRFHNGLYSSIYNGREMPISVGRRKYARLLRNRLKYAFLEMKKAIEEDDVETMQKIFSEGGIKSKIFAKPSCFHATLGKYLVGKYLSEFPYIFDPFGGFSGRMLGTVALNDMFSNRRYVGRDICVSQVNEAHRIIKELGIDAEYEVGDIFDNNIWNTPNGEPFAILTCPPYLTCQFKEEWLDMFDGTEEAKKHMEEYAYSMKDVESTEQWNGTSANLSMASFLWMCLVIGKYWDTNCQRFLFVEDDSHSPLDPYIPEVIENHSKLTQTTNYEFIYVIDRDKLDEKIVNFAKKCYENYRIKNA